MLVFEQLVIQRNIRKIRKYLLPGKYYQNLGIAKASLSENL